MLEIDITASSLKGTKHSESQGNQDRFMITSPDIPSPILGEEAFEHIFTVADSEEFKLIAAVSDGISSTPKAGEAAQKTLSILHELAESDVEPEKWCVQINSRVRKEFFSWDTCESFGAATLSYLIFRNGKVYPVNVGDSPIYLLRDNKLTCLYKEQTVLVQDIWGQERYALDKYMGNPNYITVPQENVEQPIIPHDGDVFLVCSDGLTNGLQSEDGEEPLIRLKKLMGCKGETANGLCAQAEERSNDDITAILIRITEI